MDTRFERTKQKLGEGCFGVVYKGKDNLTREDVAIKQFKRGTGYKEIKRTDAIPPHRNIIKYLKVDYRNLQIIMELCDCDLRYHYQNISVGTTESINIAKQCMDGLQHLHVNGIVHRDLKPPNIMLKGDIVKITDFGLAKVDLLKDGEMELYMDTQYGYYGFVAPEIRAGRNYTNSVDVYSMGVVFQWMYDNQGGQEKNPEFSYLSKQMSNDYPKNRPAIVHILKKLCIIESQPTARRSQNPRQHNNGAEAGNFLAGVGLAAAAVAAGGFILSKLAQVL